MRFVVTKGPLNEVDVKLHWTTKEKLKQAFTWGVCLPLTIFGVVFGIKQIDKQTTEN